MNKKIIISVTFAIVFALVLSGCGKDNTASDVTDDVVVCDENGNTYASEQEAKDAGLSEAEYGATYCQYSEETESIDDAVPATPTTPVVETEAEQQEKTVPAEKFSASEQTTGSKKHDDFMLEHVKHNDLGTKYAVQFQLDRKHDAKTHEAPYTVATYHAHDTKHNHGRIEVEIHEIDKSKFDPTKIIEPKHNKFVQDIIVGDSGHDDRILFVVHLEEKATGKFNLSSNVANNQDATIVLDVLE